IPEYLRNELDVLWVEMDSISLSHRQVVEKKDFVKVCFFQLVNSSNLFQVCAIWHPNGENATKTLLLVQHTSKGPITPFYGMRKIIRVDELAWIKVRVRAYLEGFLMLLLLGFLSV
ncbi:hypothetical protein DFH28DRAFT_896733, partial [Melampsora americana]